MYWRYPRNSGGPVANLDPVFTRGNAPIFHGMLRSLADATGPGYIGSVPEPCYLDVYKIGILSRDDGELKVGEELETDSSLYDIHSILAGSARREPREDFTVEQFFHHANILSGQDVGEVDGNAVGDEAEIRPHLNIKSGGWTSWALDRIETARACKPGTSPGPGTSDIIWNDLCDYFDVNSRLWTESWNSPAGVDARERFRQLRLWYHDPDLTTDKFRCSGLGQLAQCLAGFAALIHGARLDIDNLMGACVKQMHACDDAAPVPFTEADSLAWKVLTGIVGVATAGNALAVPIATVALLDTLTKEMSAKSELPQGEQFYDILDNYLKEADKVLQSTARGVSDLVKRMNGIVEGFPEVPRW